jgi:hypothetical protein
MGHRVNCIELQPTVPRPSRATASGLATFPIRSPIIAAMFFTAHWHRDKASRSQITPSSPSVAPPYCGLLASFSTGRYRPVASGGKIYQVDRLST